MLLKRPKGAYGNPYLKVIKLILFGEIVLLGSSYLLWNRLNHSREFRYYMDNNWPWILQKYYQLGKFANPLYECELADRKYWKSIEAKK